MKALEVVAFLKILWHDLEGSNVWAVGCINHKGLGRHWRTTVTRKCPTSFLEKLIAYLCLIINLLQKYDYLL
jgi:hypothetical protein